jgi:protein SCO1/2
MIRSIKNSVLFIVIAFYSCHHHEMADALPFINKPDFTPEWISKGDKAYASIHRIPDFLFIDQDGNNITGKTVANKVYVADFFFTHCGSICPKMTANMEKLADHYKNNPDVMFLSHTVLPEMDSVPVLKKYAEEKNVSSKQWHLLTGNKDSIYELAKKQYYAGDTIGYYQAGNEFLHTENFILVDRHRRIRGVYNGTLDVEMDRLKEDIDILLKED